MFKFSRCICIQSPEQEKATSFYADVMGLQEVRVMPGSAELTAGPMRVFIDEGQPLGPIMEFLTPDVERAKAMLLTTGCTEVHWDGAGGRCYMKDPFGNVFNLFQAPEAFEGHQH